MPWPGGLQGGNTCPPTGHCQNVNQGFIWSKNQRLHAVSFTHTDTIELIVVFLSDIMNFSLTIRLEEKGIIEQLTGNFFFSPQTVIIK